MTKAEKALYAELEKIANSARRGFITISECNVLMMREIDNYTGFERRMKAYHKMYTILAAITRE